MKRVFRNNVARNTKQLNTPVLQQMKKNNKVEHIFSYYQQDSSKISYQGRKLKSAVLHENICSPAGLKNRGMPYIQKNMYSELGEIDDKLSRKHVPLSLFHMNRRLFLRHGW